MAKAEIDSATGFGGLLEAHPDLVAGGAVVQIWQAVHSRECDSGGAVTPGYEEAAVRIPLAEVRPVRLPRDEGASLIGNRGFGGGTKTRIPAPGRELQQRPG